MTTFRPFEVKAIRLLCSGILDADELLAIERHSGPSRYDYTGSGYVLTVFDVTPAGLSHVGSSPLVTGRHGDVNCAFIVRIAGRKLSLECHTVGEIDVHDGFREQPVIVEL